ncbi:RnfABCDGE type electron transport complex subunit G [Desulfosudis oleivorans]|uniref:Ion-translocating oxidoreductase complex subunit G n=1 Tax=Desulfosudis oleivorans (strain DSM 6200 / JCM 39069 / Hxd3) TaxID=96561 RepID=A8ZY04_DESOH|nr:FMN-binding protein [Desulfosudis oleivorans]ABW68631.1 electron transport complex, RnfABCDGE type, G subunit [Desulfosudis oleivorans Hxd3]
MRELIKMVVVLTVLTAVSGGLLAGVRAATQDKIELQVLNFVQGPVLREMFANASNDMIADRFTLGEGKEAVTLFPIAVDGKVRYVALSVSGKGGFGGDVGLMVGVDIDTGTIASAGVTTHSETPGIGSRAKSEPDLVNRFVGLPVTQTFKVKSAGGQIDAISGATVTSGAVCNAATNAGEIYQQLEDEIKNKIASL